MLAERVPLWLRSGRGWKGRAALLAVGALSGLALPPVFALPLWIVGFTALTLTLSTAQSTRQAFGAGWWFGFGHHLVGLYWIAIALLVDVKQYAWLIPFAVSLIPAAAACFAGAAGVMAHVLKRRGWFSPIAVAVLWSLSEVARGETFVAFPWNPAASIWAFADAPLQAASVLGARGLGLLTMLIATLPAYRWLAGRGRWLAWAVPALLTAGLFGFGAARLPDGPVPPLPDARIRIVQASIPQSLKWDRDLAMQHLGKHLELSRGDGPAVVIWPEVAVPFIVEEGAPMLRYIASGLEGQWLITGATRRERGGDPQKIWNSIVVLSPEARLEGAYDKIRLVPFGEYIPFRRWIPFIDRIAGGLGELTPGKAEPEALQAAQLGPFAGLVCYEAVFTEALRHTFVKKISWILNVTNDAWFGNSSGPYQHLHQARLRAVEYGLPVVRAANTGISAIIDPYGRVVASLPLGEAGVLNGAVPQPVVRTPLYARYGAIGYILFIGVCALISLALTRTRTLK